MTSKNKILCTIISAIVVLVSVVAIALINNHSDFKLNSSKGNVSATYTDEYKAISYANLVEIDEKEIWNNKELNIISGTIKDTNNIKLKVGGDVSYDSLVKIEVSDCIKGNVKSGEVIEVLAGCLTNPKGIWQEDCMVNSSMTKGDFGIFMIEENHTSIESGNSILQLSDIARYNFPDAMHYCFVEKENEVIYFKDFYVELEDSSDINYIKEYINGKLAE